MLYSMGEGCDRHRALQNSWLRIALGQDLLSSIITGISYAVPSHLLILNANESSFAEVMK